MSLTKGKSTYKFDRVIPSGKGVLLGLRIKETNDENNAAINKKKLKYEIVHGKFGHCGERVNMATASKLGFKVKTPDRPCESCIASKQRQKNVRKEALNKAMKKGERVYVDGSSMKKESKGGAKFWYLFVDEFTGYKDSVFVAAKSQLAKAEADLRERWKNKGIDVMNIRCDDAGENKKFKEEIVKRNLKINFEYTGADTPQHNGVVERAFATLIGRARAMFTEAGIEGDLRDKLWAECAGTATKLSNVLVEKKDDECNYEKLFGSMPKYAYHLCTFGEIGMVLNRKNKKMRRKMAKRARAYLFVGYLDSHNGDVYRMWNFKNGRIATTRDVRFLKRIYKEYVRVNEDEDDISSDEDTLDVEITENIGDHANEIDDDVDEDGISEKTKSLDIEVPEEEGHRTRSKGLRENIVAIDRNNDKLRNEVRTLAVSWHPATFTDIVDICLVGRTDDEYVNPIRFRDAWDHPVETDRKLWRETIRKEFRDMINKHVWRNIKKERYP